MALLEIGSMITDIKSLIKELEKLHESQVHLPENIVKHRNEQKGEQMREER